MDSYVTSGSDWTREHVEARLIATFVTMPGTPVLRIGRRFAHGIGGERSILTDTLNWALLLEHDPDGHRFLYTWAQCKASQRSFGAVCRNNGWARATAEDGRRRAANTIAAALAAETDKGVDSRKGSPGPSGNAEACLALAKA